MQQEQIEDDKINEFLLLEKANVHSHYDNTNQSNFPNIDTLENAELLIVSKNNRNQRNFNNIDDSTYHDLQRPNIKKRTLPKTNSFNGPIFSIQGSNSLKVTPKPQNIFAKPRIEYFQKTIIEKEETELKIMMKENAKKKYIRDLWNNNFLIIAMFIKKFIETLKSINIVSKFMRMTEYHYNIIADKVYFYNGFDDSIKQTWMVPSKTTKKFVRFLFIFDI